MRAAVLARYGLTEHDLLGEGGESWVYSLPEGRMLRIYKDSNNKRRYLQLTQAFYEGIHGKFSFETPRIMEIQEEEGVLYSIMNRIEGKDMSKVLPTLNADDKKKVLQNYFDAMEEIHSVSFPADKPYGQILAEKPVTAATWTEFLRASIQERLERGAQFLEKDIENLPQLIERLMKHSVMFDAHPPKELVHGDYFPHNILVNDNLNIVGVIDMSNLTVIGDHMMDVTSSYIFLETTNSYQPADSEILWPIVVKKYGPEIQETMDFYRPYYAFYFSDAGGEDATTYPSLYPWCVKTLKEYQKS